MRPDGRGRSKRSRQSRRRDGADRLCRLSPSLRGGGVNEAPVERTILVTGGAGFIGSALCRHLIRGGRPRVVNLDKLTYAASPASLEEVAASPHYRFVRGDIGDRALVAELLAAERGDAIMHLAAESHVDRSLADAGVFIESF